MMVAIGAIAQDSVNITLTLNMKNETFDPANVYLAGGADFGVPGDNAMDDTDGDSTFTITVRMPVGYTGFYTFANGACADFSCKENLAGKPCGDPNNFNDRSMGPINSDTTIQHCFGECTTDGSCPPPPSQVNVTFQVNMAGLTVDTAGMHLGANFDGWSGSLDMAQVNDSIWEVTSALDANSQYEFKYVNGTDWEVIDSLDGQSCVMNFGGFVNRIVNVGTEDLTTCAYFGRCTPCEVLPSVTLQVDMNNVATDTAGVFIGANWDGWTGSISMTDMDGDDVWEYTTTLEPGTYEYKFLNGGWDGQEEFDPATEDSLCTLTTGAYTNRVFTVDGSGDITECYEFNSCTACKTTGIRPTVESLVSVRPTRVDGGMFEVAFLNVHSNNYQLEVSDLMGRTIVREVLPGSTQAYQASTSSWTKGIYLVRIGTKTQQQTVKVLVE